MYPHSYPYPPANGGESYGYAYNQYGSAPGPSYAGASPSYPPGVPGAGAYNGAPSAYGVAPPAQDHAAMFSDPTAFEQMYRSQLAQLTFNSKPIITNLTLIAQEHVHRMATLVAKIIDAHIMLTAPAYKLPSMYLLDSICKNIGSPYTELWTPRVATLFLESYRVVDQPTKRRLEDLLATWRVAGAGGRPLFGDNAQWTIERSLFGSQGPTPKTSSLQPTQSQVLANVERLLALRTQERSRNPGDATIVERIQLLRSLKSKVQSSEAGPELLAEVQRELDSLGGAMHEARATPPVRSAPPAAPSAGAGPNAAAPSASELIANLMKAGLLPSTTATPPPATSEVATPAPTLPTPERISQDKNYTDFMLSLDLRLTSLDLARPPPEVELVVKENLPLPCRQCANRYPDTEAGKNGLDVHLDWHFAQNRRSRASIARGQSRSWLDPASRWIRSGFDDVAERTSNDQDGAMITPTQELALREKFNKTFVVVPEDAEIAARPCRICKEKFRSEWSEDQEEWIWRNAIELDQGYVHASCNHSAKVMSESVKEELAPAGPPLASIASSNTEPAEVVAKASKDLPIKEEDGLLKRKATPDDFSPHKKNARDGAGEPIGAEEGPVA